MPTFPGFRCLPALLLFATACARPAPDAARDIVSLIPQGSVALRAFGMEGRLAGVITDDPVCPAGCVRLGRLGALDSESLLVLKPRILLASAPGGMLPPDPVVARLRQTPGVQVVEMTEPRTMDEATAQIERLADALGRPQKALASLQTMRDDFKRTLEEAGHRPGARPRVLLLAGLSPQPGALGPGMLHGALLDAVGAINALPPNAPDWLPLDLEAVAQINPDVILLLNPDRTDKEAQLALQAELEAAFRNLPKRAGAPRRLRLVSDPLAMIPSTNLPQLAKAMADAIGNERQAPRDPPGNAGLQAR